MIQKIDLNNLDKSTWETFKFEDIAQKISKTIKPDEAKVDIYIGLEHIDANDIHIRRKGVPADVKGGKLRCYPGDVIFGKRRAYQRKAAIVDFDGICSAHAFVFRANEEIIDSKLFPFFLHSDQFMHRMIDISVGGLSPTINWGDLKQQEFLLPPKDQQVKLAELLWAMDDVVERELETSKAVKETYLVKIERELINRKNQKVHFEDLGEVIRGVGYKPNDLLDSYSDNNCIILRSNNIFESRINYDDIKILNLEGVKSKQILKQGDFAICMSNGSKDLVGKSALYVDEGKNVSIGSFCAGFRPNDLLSQRILKHLFSSESYRYAIKRILTGSAINNLKPSDIESLFLRLEEDKSKMEEVLIELDVLDSNIGVLDSKIQSSKALQKSLINQVF
ncbi:restriction endonuclease subunit S [Polaribacter staleyi]|uniref:restriction endonuclease subunit S n=1 Tax=Polaribacter staleyi TaxID=2022337 RepID=UPI0031BB19B5